jgi:hypothetical protein
MSIPWYGWNEFREVMEPFIKQAYEKEITFEEFDNILKQKMNELHEKYDKKQEEFVGWLGGEEEYLALYDKKEQCGDAFGANLIDFLFDEYKGKKVKITIEVVE